MPIFGPCHGPSTAFYERPYNDGKYTQDEWYD